MEYRDTRALALLRLGARSEAATFREGQEEAIRHVVEGRGRLLVVQRTGWGKSFVYFVATKLLREQGSGPTLLVSPLLALMRNQLAAAERMGVRAVTISSENEDEWGEIEEQLRRDETDILLVSPERFKNDRFRLETLPIIAGRIAMLVIDEAHCISDWGHDFRPHYRLLDRTVRMLPPNVRLLATTATANNRVMEDLVEVLGPNLAVSRGNLDRPSLRLQTIHLPDQAERLAWLASHIPSLPGSGIIYTLTVRDANRVAEWLQSRGVHVEAYTSRTGESRPDLEQALLDNRIKALVATPALGMGYDKPDLGFVVHYQTPASVVTYYQQVGRAGRALPMAYGVLLSGVEEFNITDYFIESAFPTRQEVGAVLDALAAAPAGLSVGELQAAVNVSKGRIEHAMSLLSLESPAPAVKQGGKWQLTAASLSGAFWDRADRLIDLRRTEQAQMQAYVNLQSGHMRFPIEALDGDPSSVSEPQMAPLPTTPDPALVQEAASFLRRTTVAIDPRKKWPGELPVYGLRGMIPPELQAQPGKALCVWGDPGWGRLVKHGKYTVASFDDLLVEACARLVGDWDPRPAPTWVTCIPSLQHPTLVREFAQRVAGRLNLAFHPLLAKTGPRPPQKKMSNSVQQARNVDGAFAIAGGSVPSGPVLLIDDMVDSRWTLTVCAWLLRKAGSGEVWPLVLAVTGGDE